MPIVKDVLARLSSQAGVTAIVSTRIYAGILPQEPTYPALTYNIITRTKEHCFGSDPGNEMIRLQLDCWAKTYAESLSLAGAVRTALSRWRGQQTNYYVEDSLADNWQDMFEDESEQRIYRASIEFLIYFR